jgi:hypothetical protein
MTAAAASTDPLRIGRIREWLALGAFIALVLIVAMLRHGYEGITHDAQLYSFQAMARLKPALLGNDLYLRFGSQDNYTLFSPLYAAVMGMIGFEPAAALITLLSQIAFLFAAWFLARELMPQRQARLGVALLVAVPGFYGALGIWSFMEGFVTPRLACEALILVSVGAMLTKRYWLACACLVAGAALHPLMAMAGVAMALYIRFMPVLPRAVIAALIGLAALVTIAAAMIIPSDSPLRLSGEWLTLVQERQGFLFVTQWVAQDWARAAVHFTTLLVGVIVLPGESAGRLLCAAGIVVALAGLLLSLIGGDIMNLALVIQGQPWRWLWLAAVLSPLLAPLILTRCWQLGRVGGLSIVLIVIAWLAMDEPYTIIAGPLAIAAAAAATLKKLPGERAQRLMLIGGFLMLAVVVIRSVANMILSEEGMPDQSAMPAAIRAIRDYSRDGLLPCVVVIAAWWLLTSHRTQAARTIVAAACVLGCIALVPASASEWQQRQFPQSDYDAFASWRRHIPPGEEVLWIEGSVETWALLERPRYLTNNQMASILFSRGARAELRRRALQLAPLGEEEPYIFWKEDRKLIRKGEHQTLANLCAAIEARFIVTRNDLSETPIETAPAGASRGYHGLKLFQCER